MSEHSFRPPNALELRESGGETIVGIDDTGTTVKLRSQETMRGPDSAGFSFDRAFPMDTQQQEVFEYGVRGIVDGAFDQALQALLGPNMHTHRCHGWLQWHRVCLRPDWLGQVAHHDGACL